jgi:hypothetical protein
MSTALQRLDRDLRGIFGSRFLTLVVYGERTRAARHAHGDEHGRGTAFQADVQATQTLAIVETLTGEDLRACAGHVGAWHDAGLATPLLLAAHEFNRSLDAFPLEFGTILADYTIVAGADPFERLSPDAADVRRAVEVQARSHLLHLREGYLETRGRADAMAVLIVRSAPALAALVTSVARLEGRDTHDPAAAGRHAEHLLGIDTSIMARIVDLAGVQEMASAEANQLFPAYLDAVQRLVQYVDRWSAR